ncbi:tetratricopeptide repeat protein [Aquimarina gracilis]|uniref:histidine kinase n=1 Tax=Aquimarina gracilis TaxID=874422 RepID=A0ABU5ZSY4_9FLAO|nr:tetratricopeptide repeat protein [Aquimarina gracilis]MEB3345115.1 tetratricopeptide repeat protein [Aquimarina gracilis]
MYFTFFINIALLSLQLSAQNTFQKRVDSLEQIIATFPDDTLRVSALNALAFEFKYKNTERAFQLANEASAISKELKYQKGLLKSYYYFSILYREDDKLDSAFYYINKGIVLAKETKDSMILGNLHNAEGRLYKIRGNNAKALEAYQKSLIINELLGDNLSMASTANNIASLHLELKNYDLALEYAQRAESVAALINSKRFQAMALSNVATAYSYLNNNEKALEYFTKSLNIAKEGRMTQGVVINSIKIAKILIQQKDYLKARKTLEESLQLSHKVNDKMGIAESLQYLARISLKTDDLDLALSEAKEAYNISLEIGSVGNIADMALLLSDVYEKMNQPKRSLESFKEYTQIKDSIFNIEKNKQIEELETQYQTAGKDQQIAELQSKNELEALKARQRMRMAVIPLIGLFIFILFTIYLISLNKKYKRTSEELTVQNNLVKKQNSQIEQSLEEKDLLMHELNHRVKNNLLIIENLLTAQIAQLKNAEASDILNESKKRIQSIALIHSELFASELPDMVNMKNYLTKILETNLKTQSNIKSIIKVGDFALNSSKALAIGLITNELITNCIKHAFEANQQGTVELIHKMEGKSLFLEIKDNGKKGNKIHNSVQDENDTAYFGHQLVKGLCRQLGGSTEFIFQDGFLARLEIPNA